ncbi:hypothetical protein DFJ73DRAFT_795833 [Zopfochytrium polystomum]|nr:hypothetical protein DFJ73DRAFT_795833 [Zopfochytrium polystomum]
MSFFLQRILLPFALWVQMDHSILSLSKVFRGPPCDATMVCGQERELVEAAIDGASELGRVDALDRRQTKATAAQANASTGGGGVSDTVVPLQISETALLRWTAPRPAPGFTTALPTVSATCEYELPVVEVENSMRQPGLARSTEAATAAHPPDTLSVLQQHIALFDRADRGVVYPSDTFARSPSLLPSPTLPM